MYAVSGNLLNVNLSERTLRKEKLPEEAYRNYLGGYGLGVALLMDRMDPGTDPLGPENILGFATGYLTGTGAFIASRYMVFSKSPSTKGFGDANCGGYFGKKMKQAGFDVLLINGVASAPVYLLVDDGQARLKSADRLWGKDCYETEDLLKRLHGEDCEVACIGPAGEKMSMIAGISTDKGRFAARSGIGAVMGSKKLKAVVLKGTQPIVLSDPGGMKALRKKHRGILKDDFPADLSRYGTPSFYEASLQLGDAPVKNWAGSVEDLPEANRVDAEGILKYQLKRYACSDCPVGCGGLLRVESGPYKTKAEVHKVEYETMVMFGSNLLNNNVESLIRINDLCNRYGMDTIGCGALCSFAVECFQNGLIDRHQTGGLDLRWGDSEAILSLVESIGLAEGIGAVLSRGFEAAIAAFGEQSRPYAIAVRNEALPGHDPRFSVGYALSYYSDPTPARHTQGTTADPVAGYEQPEFGNDQFTGRARYHHDNVNLTHVMNAAGLCLFGYFMLDCHFVPEFLSAADGKSWAMEELHAIGRRIAVLRHLFNLKAGIDFRNHPFPARVLGNPPINQGPNRGVGIDLDTMVREYLEEAGFDLQTARPKTEVLEELGLSKYASSG
ncbi:MAG: aldehyde ferredoxin oxidoreductase family protein [Spirochaetaceae bacterium]|nr:MAG: aldehyde ferredoxin oxidoreductase family protein [Spirochaetaceae bacterium]